VQNYVLSSPYVGGAIEKYKTFEEFLHVLGVIAEHFTIHLI
jgi:hypothetical protein